MSVAKSGRGWRLAPSLVALEAEADAIAPRRSKVSDGSIGDAAHRARKSDHNPAGGWVHAIDITHDPADGMDIHALLRQVAARGDRRVGYLISNGQIWENGRWRRYTGENPHRKHGHISIRHTYAARTDVGPWFAATAVPIASKPVAPFTPPVATPGRPVPVTNFSDLKETPMSFVALVDSGQGAGGQFLIDTSGRSIVPMSDEHSANNIRAACEYKALVGITANQLAQFRASGYVG